MPRCVKILRLLLISVCAAAFNFAQSGDLKNIDSEKIALDNVPKSESLVTPFGVKSYSLPKLTERDKNLILPASQDVIRFADFPESEKIGFVRLHDIAKCKDGGRVINVNDPCPWDILSRATSYSFRKRKYQTPAFSDIWVKNKTFQTVGVNILGFFTNIGNTDLKTVNLQTRGVKEIAEYTPPTDIKEIDRIFKYTRQGFSVNNFFFRNNLPIKENSVYALRVIAFDGKVYRTGDYRKLNLLKADKREDLIIVFQVIRKYEDGSCGILCRELQRTVAPKLDWGK